MSEPVLDKPLPPGENCRDGHIPLRGSVTIESEWGRPDPVLVREEVSPFSGLPMIVTYHGLVWVYSTPENWTADLALPVLATWVRA